MVGLVSSLSSKMFSSSLGALSRSGRQHPETDKTWKNRNWRKGDGGRSLQRLVSQGPNSHEGFPGSTALFGVVLWGLGRKKVRNKSQQQNKKCSRGERRDLRIMGIRKGNSWGESHGTDRGVGKQWKTTDNAQSGFLGKGGEGQGRAGLSLGKPPEAVFSRDTQLLHAHVPTGEWGYWTFLVGLWGFHGIMVIIQNLTLFQPLLSGGFCAKPHMHYLIQSSQQPAETVSLFPPFSSERTESREINPRGGNLSRVLE